MSELRDKLSSLKREYENTRYPGNLLADVRDRQRMRVPGWKVLAAIGAACAAAIVVAALVGPAMWREFERQNSTIAKTLDPVKGMTVQTVAVASDESTDTVPSFSVSTELGSDLVPAMSNVSEASSSTFVDVSVPSLGGVPTMDLSSDSKM